MRQYPPDACNTLYIEGLPRASRRLRLLLRLLLPLLRLLLLMSLALRLVTVCCGYLILVGWPPTGLAAASFPASPAQPM